MANNNEEYWDEDMTVELEVEDGKKVNCAVITVLNVNDNDYIALMPTDEDYETENEDEVDIWFYRLQYDPDDAEAEPELIYIEDDEEYEIVTDAFDEYLDEMEFEDMGDE